MGSLLPKKGIQPKYAQLYFLDTQNEVRNRTGAFIDKDKAEPVDEQIVSSLIQMLDEYSSVAKAFRMARDWCNTHNMIDFHLCLHSDRKITQQYNALTVSEVAAIIINDFGDGLPTRDIVVNSKDEGPKRISELHPSYMALQYPLLFPYDNVPTRDAMALCRSYGNLDLFITFTSNPKWPKIAKMLAYFPSQKAHDRPEVGTHIFKLKLTELLDGLTKKHVFGQSEAVVYVIEFQKRGLPHAHILLWLEEHSKCRTPSKIDDIFSVELPSPTYDPVGYKVVTEYMLQGPCGKDARYAACTNDGKCSKHFPKPFLAETYLDEEGYPHYRPRDNKGRLYATFKDACFAYGLLNDDRGWTKALSEASLRALGPQLRDIFITIFGRSLTDFKDLPQPNPNLLTNKDNRLIWEALDFDIKKSKAEHEHLYLLLNPEHRLIYEDVVQSVHHKKGNFYFIYGPGGTGKIFLYQTIISRLRSERRIVLVVASSGIASLLLPAGRTAHSMFVIPLDLMENNMCGIKQNKQLAELMQEVQLIIWDEAPRTQRYAFEALDITQILPVIPKAKRLEIVQACINISNCGIIARDGTLPAKMKEREDEPTWIDIPEKFLIKS
ncbi:ATP-dependent DNA helicase PIF1-like protein [Tanacetum coccineum]